MKKYELFIGVDPAMRSNGLAYGYGDKSPTVLSLGELVEIGDCEAFKAWCFENSQRRAYCVIECPTWAGRGTREVRAAALQWESMLKRRLYRPKIERVDPNVWQRELLGDASRTLGTKSAALALAESMGLVDIDEHQADAFCLHRYAKLLANGFVPTRGRS